MLLPVDVQNDCTSAAPEDSARQPVLGVVLAHALSSLALSPLIAATHPALVAGDTGVHDRGLPDLGDGAGCSYLAALSDAELIDVIGEWERVMAWAAGSQLAAIAHFSGRRSEPDQEFVADEIAPALTLAPRTAGQRADLSVDLRQRLPFLLDAVIAGDLTSVKAQIIAETTSVLDEETAASIAMTILDQACALTPGQLRHEVLKRVIEADPAAAAERAREHRRDRDVRLSNAGDGNGRIEAIMEAHDAVAVQSTIEQVARKARIPGDPRDLGEIRAEVLADLILGRCTDVNPAQSTGTTSSNATTSTGSESTGSESTGSESTGSLADAASSNGTRVTTIVNVMVGLGTLAGLLDPDPETATLGPPGWVERLGPVPGSTITDLMLDLLHDDRSGKRVGWRVVACDEESGSPHAIGHTRYRPPPALQELVRLRDRTCGFPGCRRSAIRCDIDHVTAFEDGGVTCDCNLQTLCRHHHRLKQHRSWTVTRQDGATTWTAPTSHAYRATAPDDWSMTNWPSIEEQQMWRESEVARVLKDDVPPSDGPLIEPEPTRDVSPDG